MKTDDKVLLGIGLALAGLFTYLAFKKTDNGNSLLAEAVNDVKNLEV